MRTGTSFFEASARAALPLGIWALHFTFCYVAVAVGCEAGWQRTSIQSGLSLLQWLLLAGSTLAWVAGAALLYRDCRSAGTASHGLLAQVRATAALMALLGIVWTSVPVLLLPTCHLSDTFTKALP